MDIEKIFLYRMIHISNLPFIFQTGELRCASHPDSDPKYTPIGDETLIKSRGDREIPISPGGTFLNYVSFYFGTHSPMLYVIHKGFNNVKKVPQREIIYLITSVKKVIEHTEEYVFFDGHAYEGFSHCFNSLESLSEIKMSDVKEKYWSSNTDPDLKRRKQAEFLVKTSLPITHLLGIAVYNDSANQQVKSMLDEFNLTLPVKTISNYYY